MGASNPLAVKLSLWKALLFLNKFKRKFIATMRFWKEKKKGYVGGIPGTSQGISNPPGYRGSLPWTCHLQIVRWTPGKEVLRCFQRGSGQDRLGSFHEATPLSKQISPMSLSVAHSVKANPLRRWRTMECSGKRLGIPALRESMQRLVGSRREYMRQACPTKKHEHDQPIDLAWDADIMAYAVSLLNCKASRRTNGTREARRGRKRRTRPFSTGLISQIQVGNP